MVGFDRLSYLRYTATVRPCMTRGRRLAGGSKIWTVRGIPAELQVAVSAAAKSARLTLGEWTAAALAQALGQGEAGTPEPLDLPSNPSEIARLDARLTQLERHVASFDSLGHGTQFRVDGLEHRAEDLETRLATLVQRLDGLEQNRLRFPPAATSSPPLGDGDYSEPADPALSTQGPFTRGIGSRKRLTAAGEEELQRLLSAGVDDSTIAARLGIHKRIVWARRLTESG